MKQCNIVDCAKIQKARGYCSYHYDQEWKSGRLQHKTYEKHGLNHTPEYLTWNRIKSRCYSPRNIGYKLYGGRGIKMCQRWLESFNAFYQDMGKRPANHSIERKNVDGNYEPSNCIWASSHQQAANKRNSNKVVGVSFDKQTGKWLSQLIINKRSVIIPKRYETFELAVKARKDAELIYLGYNINKG